MRSLARLSPRAASLIWASLLVGPTPAVPATGKIEWTTGINKALAEAKATARPVFVDVWAIWCVPCKEMDETTYRDPAVVAAMAGFVPLKVDQDAAENFCERHAVEALPLVLYLDGEGREIGRRMGLQRAAELLGSMETVRDGYASYVAAMARVESSPQVAASAADYLTRAGNPQRAIALLRRAIDRAPAPEQGEELALGLAEAQLAAGEAKDALGAFRRLADQATAPEQRGRALAGLVRCLRERGRAADADAALERLRAEFPERAAGLAPQD